MRHSRLAPGSPNQGSVPATPVIPGKLHLSLATKPCRRQLLALLMLLLCTFSTLVFGQAGSRMPFTFTLSTGASTSAGVYAPDGTLVKTLWSGVKYPSGTHSESWNGLTDEGQLAPNGNYSVKVVSNNVRYEWEGTVGNTSQEATGPTKHNSMQTLTNMVVVGNTAYYAVAYTEGNPGYMKFNLSNPQVKINIHESDGHAVRFLASDGARVYWAGELDYSGTTFITATNVSNDSYHTFSTGVPVRANRSQYPSCIDLTPNSYITGMAVQKNGAYLFVSHQDLNVIRVFNKTTGALVQTLSYNSPRELAIDGNDNLWMIHGINSVSRFTANSNGTLTAAGQPLTGLQQPVALNVSHDNSTLAVVDAGTSHQVKAFSVGTGAALWTLGQPGGYATSPAVANDKFYFSNTKIFRDDSYGAAHPYVCFLPDGSLWVGDLGNLRSLHFSAQRTYIQQLAYIGYFYSCFVDPNNPRRVFANYLEFEIDYTKPLAPNNGSWRLVRNWSAGRVASHDGDFDRLQCVTTLSNGRTYALATTPVTWRSTIIELPPTGNIRFTNVETANNRYKLNSDGTLWNIGDNRLGQPAVWKRQQLLGFDGNHNPQYGPETVVATTEPVTGKDPLTADGGLKRNQITSSNIVVGFNTDMPANGRGHGWHLGGVVAGTNKWLWKTSRATTYNYQGQFPPTGDYDIGNGVHYAGSFAQAVDRNIFWGYRGEFWKNGQTNKWNQYWDNGLFIGQFGEVREHGDHRQSVAGMAGNSFAGTFVKVGSDYYYYHCDEMSHCAIHRWKISNLSSIQEQTVATLTLNTQSGLLMQAFTGEDLNNFTLASTTVTPTLNLATQNNSVRWTGYVTPAFTEAYTFFATVNQKVRLWVNNELVIDNWTNAAQAEFTSRTVALEAGKRYALRMEISRGSASLAWSSPRQPKQAVPASSLFAANAPDLTKGISLNEGLPFDSPVANGMYGWTRNPADNIGDHLVYGPKWQVRTNVHSMDRDNPDIDVYSMPSPGQTRTVSRNLGAANTAQARWSITGKIALHSEAFVWPNNSGHLEVLDANNRVIARVVRSITTWPTARITINGRVVTEGSMYDMQFYGKRPQPMNITVDSTGVSFQYADFPAVTAPPLDATSDWRRPKTLQVLFYSPTDREMGINLSEMRFLSGTARLLTPPEPRLTVNSADNTLSAAHTLGNSEILVSENNAGFVAYAGPINVGTTERAAGYWKFKVRSAPGRNESPVAESPVLRPGSNVVLPLNLLSFRASRTGTQVRVNWSTTNEHNTDVCVIERSSDGREFNAIGTVKSRNTSGVHQYTFLDQQALPGTSYYRLKMVDLDASFSHSAITTVTDAAADFTIYPNPAQNVLHVQLPSHAGGQLDILSLAGKQLKQISKEAGSNTTINISTLSPGLYILRYRNGESSVSQRFVKQ